MARASRQALINAATPNLKSQSSEIYNFIRSSGVYFQNKLKDIKGILKAHFCLTQDEVEAQILKICQSMDKTATLQLFDIIEEFSKNDIKNRVEINSSNVEWLASRHSFALTLLDNILEIFHNETDKLSEELIDCIREARRVNIDPFKFATKTNLRFASFDKFQETLNALTVTKYASLGDKSIIKTQEFSTLIEQCTTLASRLKAETVENILDLLSDFVYDKNSKSYLADVGRMLKVCPSLLLIDEETFLDTLATIEQEFIQKRNMTRLEVVSRIARTPSILATSTKVIEATQSSLEKQITKLLAKSKLVKSDERSIMSQTIANNIVFNLDNFTQLTSIKAADNFGQMADTLEHFLGTDNAISCMQNLSILKRDPAVVSYVLAVLSADKDSEILRADFVNNPTKYFENYEGASSSTTGMEIERTRREKLTFKVEKLPEIKVDEEQLLELYRKIDRSKRDEVQKLLAKAQQDFLEKKRAAEEAALREKQERKAEKERQKEEERQKRLEAKRKADEEARKKKEEAAAARAATLKALQNTQSSGEVDIEQQIKTKLRKLTNYYKPIKSKNDNSRDIQKLPKLIENVYGPIYDLLKKYKKDKIADLTSVQELCMLATRVKNIDQFQLDNLEKVFMMHSILVDIIDNSKIEDIINYLNSEIKIEGPDADIFDVTDMSALQLLDDFIRPIILEDSKILLDLMDKCKFVQGDGFRFNETYYLIAIRSHLVSNLEEIENAAKEHLSKEEVEKYFASENVRIEKEKIDKSISQKSFINPMLNVSLLLQAYIQPALLYLLYRTNEEGYYQPKNQKIKYLLEKVYKKPLSPFKPKDINQTDFENYSYYLSNCQILETLESFIIAIGNINQSMQGIEVKDGYVYFFSGQIISDENIEHAMVKGRLKINDDDIRTLLPAFKKYFDINGLGLYDPRFISGTDNGKEFLHVNEMLVESYNAEQNCK